MQNDERERSYYVSGENVVEALQASRDLLGENVVSFRLQRKSETSNRFTLVLVETVEARAERKERHYTLRERWEYELESLEKLLAELEQKRETVKTRIHELRELIARTETE